MTATMMSNSNSNLGDAMPFVIPLPAPPADMNKVEFSLYLSVLHHGFACLWDGDMTPASKQTVTVTADWFLDYLNKREHVA